MELTPMKTKSNSGCSTHPKGKGTVILFSGTVHELCTENARNRQKQTSFEDYPGWKYPIDLLGVGDIATYDRSKTEEPAQYVIEEIHDHGKDPDQRVVVARKLLSGKENERFIFNARFIVGGKTVDLYYNQAIHIRNVEQAISTRQKVNAQGGYN